MSNGNKPTDQLPEVKKPAENKPEVGTNIEEQQDASRLKRAEAKEKSDEFKHKGSMRQFLKDLGLGPAFEIIDSAAEAVMSTTDKDSALHKAAEAVHDYAAGHDGSHTDGQTFKRANGSSVEVSYDNSGNPKEIVFPGEYSLIRNDDGTWRQMTPDGLHELHARYKNVRVDEDGTVSLESEDGSQNYVENPDGSRDVIDMDTGMVDRRYPDDHHEVYDGRTSSRVSFTSPDGREFRKTDQGLEYTIKQGDNPWIVVKDSLKAQGNSNPSNAEIVAELDRAEKAIVKDRLREQGNPDPSDAEIAAELKRIEKDTGKRAIEQPIYADRAFVIPPKEESVAPSHDTKLEEKDTSEEGKKKTSEAAQEEQNIEAPQPTANMDTNDHGFPTAITYPDKTECRLIYDDQDRVRNIYDPEGREWSDTTGEGDWVVKEKDGKTRSWRGTVTPGKDGSLTFLETDTGRGIYVAPDGTETKFEAHASVGT